MSMTSINQSKEVVEAILSGENTKALNYLYKSSLPQIIKYVCMNSGSEDEAKDIFQDAVVSLFTTVKLGKYDIEKDVNGFLYFVSRNLWINYVKKKRTLCGAWQIAFNTERGEPFGCDHRQRKEGTN